MPINSRTKGAVFERAMATRLTTWAGIVVKRILDQAREGGHDLRLGRWRIECKAYKSLGKIEDALQQCEVGKRDTDIAVVIAKENNCPPMVAMRLSDFLDLTQRLQLGLTNHPWE